ncbi:MAG: hypothetical protein HY752_05940 [Nitrospirae bacterium]|nr:hypothetical protein [Nitrospirota bacterium]
MIDKIWEILTTFTEEAQNAAFAKCKELGFDTSRGIVPLDESFINLNTAKFILVDAIEKKKLIQLPITVQKTLFNNLEAISKYLVGLTGGTDQITNLTDTIEQLNTAIWQFGFHNLSEEVLGYQTKLNQLKIQDVEIKRIKNDLEGGLNLKNKLEIFLGEVEKTTEKLQSITTSSDENAKKINDNLTQSAEINQKATQILSAIQQTEKGAKELSSTMETLKGKVDNWAKEIKELSEKSEKIKEDLTEREKKLNLLIENTDNTLKRVEDLLPGATSAGLASSFRQRKEDITKSKKYWVVGFVGSLIFLVLMVSWIIYAFTEHIGKVEWWAYLLQRVPLTFPLIWLGWFFERNYGHKIRLEEDYAFKESISRAFEGYKKQMQEVDPEVALPRLCDRTISILSETPLRVFERKTSDETPANSFLERFMPKGKKEQKG